MVKARAPAGDGRGLTFADAMKMSFFMDSNAFDHLFDTLDLARQHAAN